MSRRYNNNDAPIWVLQQAGVVVAVLANAAGKRIAAAQMNEAGV